MAEERIRIVIDALNLAKRELESLKKQIGDVDKTTEKTGGTFGNLKKILGTLGIAVVAKQIATFTYEATKLASRVETLGVVTETLGRNVGMSETEIRDLEKSVQDLGITTQASRQSLALMMQAQIDLSHATNLARMAQDAAVVAGVNSSEAFERLVQVVSSGNVRMARTMGIMVNFNDAYEKAADAIGKTSQELTENEKIQIRANAVLEQSEQIAGAYTSAMETVGKQLTSTPRYVEEFRRALGEKFIPVLGVANKAFQEFLKTGTQILEWGKNVEEALEDHNRVMVRSADSYEEYRKEMIRSLVVAKDLSEEEAKALYQRDRIVAKIEELKETQGDFNQEQLMSMVLAGDLNEDMAGLIYTYMEQNYQLERTASNLGIVSEHTFNVTRAIEGITGSVNRGNTELDIFAKKLGEAELALDGTSESLEDAVPKHEGTWEKWSREAIRNMILVEAWAQATSDGVIEEWEEADLLAKASALNLGTEIETALQEGIDTYQTFDEGITGSWDDIDKLYAEPEIHVVTSGETLSSIAEKHGVLISDLLQANALGDPDTIRPGQEITIHVKVSGGYSTGGGGGGGGGRGGGRGSMSVSDLVASGGLRGHAGGGKLDFSQMVAVGEEGFEIITPDGWVLPNEVSEWLVRAGLFNGRQLYTGGILDGSSTYDSSINTRQYTLTPSGGTSSDSDITTRQYDLEEYYGTKPSSSSSTKIAESVADVAESTAKTAENAVSAVLESTQQTEKAVNNVVSATTQAVEKIRDQISLDNERSRRMLEEQLEVLRQLAKASDIEIAMESAVSRATA